MKKINFIKFALDLVMGIVFALLYNTRVLGGMTFHEIAGLAIGFAVLVHIILNWKWVKNVTLSIFSRKIALKTRIGYALNILLLLDMAVIIISGIFISKVLFPGLRMHNSFFNQRTHTASAYIGLTLIGIHLGLHWKWVMNVFKKIIKINQPNKILGQAARMAAVLVLAFGIYSMISTNYFSNTAGIFGIGSPAAMQHDRGMRPDFQFQGPAQNDNGTADTQQSGGDIGNSNSNSRNYYDGTGGKPDFTREGRGMKDSKGMGSANAAGVLARYMSIMGVFTILSYYIEKLLIRRKTA